MQAKRRMRLLDIFKQLTQITVIRVCCICEHRLYCEVSSNVAFSTSWECVCVCVGIRTVKESEPRQRLRGPRDAYANNIVRWHVRVAPNSIHSVVRSFRTFLPGFRLNRLRYKHIYTANQPSINESIDFPF